jgi:hypothetical protein
MVEILKFIRTETAFDPEFIKCSHPLSRMRGPGLKSLAAGLLGPCYAGLQNASSKLGKGV